MKTKTVSYIIDLPPGWQDTDVVPYIMESKFSGTLLSGYRRFKVTVELPCFGGSADIEQTIPTLTNEIKTGFQE